MKSDVEATISGLPFDQTAVSGISISYGYNTVPTATLQLAAPYIEEVASSFLNDPDQFKVSTRGSPVEITLNCKTGTINFSGVFDGLSFTQSPGGYQHSAVLKSKFQVMHELYPKFPGVDPTSILPFKRTPITNYQGQGSDPYQFFETPLKNVEAAGKTVVEYFIELIKAMVDAQQASGTTSALSSDLAPLLEIFKDKVYIESIDKVKDILDNIDLTYVSDTEALASTSMPYLVDLVIGARDTLWDTLQTGLDSMGCMLLPAKDKLFVVPHASFLKMSGASEPGDREVATEPNQAFPADYSNFTVNDVPYRNLRACFVVPVVRDGLPAIWSYVSQALGVYPKDGDTGGISDDGSSGVLIVPAPTYLIQNVDSLYMQNTEMKQKIKDGSFAGQIVDDHSQVKDKAKEHIQKMIDSKQPFQEALDKHAKMRLLQEKYAERGGSFTMQFKPSWVPGTTGFLYSRHPKLSYQFYVTNVTHVISMSGGNIGTAITSVNFCSCRYGGDPSSVNGADSADLFNYDSGKMSSLQKDWLSDVGGTAIDDTNK